MGRRAALSRLVVAEWVALAERASLVGQGSSGGRGEFGRYSAALVGQVAEARTVVAEQKAEARIVVSGGR